MDKGARAKQQAFIAALALKYGDQFNDDPILKRYITQEFTLRESKGKPVDYTHALKFANYGLEGLLQAPRESRPSSAGIFSQPRLEPLAAQDGVEHAPEP